MNDEKIKLFVTDDNEMVLEGITALAESDPCIEVVGCCDNGLEVLEKVQAAQPDVLVLDISLPGRNGLEVCRMVKAQMPETAIVMLSMNASERVVIGALDNGASGYLIKEAVSRDLCQAIHAVARGEVYLAEGIPRALLEKVAARA